MSKTRSPLFLATVLTFIGLNSAPARAEREPGVTDDKILLGQITDVNGKSSSRPVEIKRGSDIFFKEVNAAGGVHGRKIEVIAFDDEYEPKNSVNGAKVLIEDKKVFALFEPYGSAPAKAIMPFVEKHRIPMLFASSQGTFLRNPVNPYIFNIRPDTDIETQTMGEFLVKKKKLKKVGVFYQNDAIKTSSATSVHDTFEKLGLQQPKQTTVIRNTVEVAQAVAQNKAEGQEAVLLFSSPKPAVEFIKECVKQGYKPIFVGFSGTSSEELAAAQKETGAEVYVVNSVPNVAVPQYDFVRKYVKAATAEGQKPAEAAFEGYLNAAVFVEAAKRAGKTLTRESLTKALESMDKADFGGIKISFSPKSHQALTRAYLNQVKNGGFVPVAE